MRDERAVFVRNPERAIGQRHKPFWIIARGIRGNNVPVEIRDGFARAGRAIDVTRVRGSNRRFQSNGSFELCCAIGEHFELANGWREVRNRFDLDAARSAHIRASVRQAVVFVARRGTRNRRQR